MNINPQLRALNHILIIILVCLASTVYCQTGNTVGLLLNSEESFNGYTLLTPTNSDNTYLIDNCGYLVNTWESEYGPGLAAHLTPLGTLVRSGRINSNFAAGGSGGLVQEFDWNGNVIWESPVSTSLYHQHHDVKPLPNGNILVLAWELNSAIDAALLGRDPALITDDGIWTELLLEIEPVGVDDFLIKWEWHLRDHLIQDIDPSIDNFGEIVDHPELVDLNYPHGISAVDLFHANALDYNEERDQIVINSRNYNEFYIIDHSTTTEEAASHSGGNAGQGGDILYRYGNPATYQRGTETDQKFFQQHGSNWVKEGIYKNSIIVFNNGTTRPQGSFSSVEIVTPTWNGSSYDIDSNEAFGPDGFAFAYVGTPTASFFSSRISNATVQPNGNILICNGQEGTFFEINEDKETVWEYVNPVLGDNIVQQGDSNPTSSVFSTERYGIDFSGLPINIQSASPIELNSDYDCVITQEVVNIIDQGLIDVNLVANPITDFVIIDNLSNRNLVCTMYDLFGRQVMPIFKSDQSKIYKPTNLSAGYYLLRIRDAANDVENIFKVIKR